MEVKRIEVKPCKTVEEAAAMMRDLSAKYGANGDEINAVMLLMAADLATSLHNRLAVSGLTVDAGLSASVNAVNVALMLIFRDCIANGFERDFADGVGEEFCGILRKYCDTLSLDRAKKTYEGLN